VEQGLIEAGLRPYFDVVIDSTLVGFAKPDPRIFGHALAVSGADPSHVLHVGDMYHADVVGARQAGLHALLLDPFDDWGDVDCERVPDLSTLAERLHASRNATTDRSSQ
jgi:putative hydrolase of the HAD superfamily